MGLEPTRHCCHKILSLARLPVPTLPQTAFRFICLNARHSITKYTVCVNTFFDFFYSFFGSFYHYYVKAHDALSNTLCSVLITSCS